MTARPGWDEYFLGVAEAVSRRADCTRRSVGAVLVKDHRIVSTGYNGAPRGHQGCLSDGACPRGRHFNLGPVISADGPRDQCACGEWWPCPDASAPGSDYANCVAIHAEANALLYANHSDCLSATLYVTDEPCSDCRKLCAGAGVARVTWPRGTVMLTAVLTD